MKKIVFIGGPTASGKTNLAVELAKKFNGELINADSRQIYKYLDIGTNKGDIKNIDGQNYIDDVPIHLVSFLNPDERYSVFDFKISAEKLIESIIAKGKLPIIVGGTGLYIDSIIKDYQLSSETDIKYREKLEQKSLSELTSILSTDFPKDFNNLNTSDKSNPRRLVRLLEKLKLGNSSTSSNQCKYDYLFLYPEYNWEELSHKIDNRVEQMFTEGLVKETQKVLDLGFKKDSVALQGTGYKQVLLLLDGSNSLPECLELVKISHKQYAKRQKTWFEGKGRNYNLVKISSIQEAENKVKSFI